MSIISKKKKKKEVGMGHETRQNKTKGIKNGLEAGRTMS